GEGPVRLQTWLVRAASDEAESAGGLMVATFQVAIALGAVFGGLLVDHAGGASAFAYCGIATLLAALAAVLMGPKRAG
ncbi:MFS transporter, partial [Mesorhizobium sp. M4B.F.Ca.ET.017.02.2.1]